MQRATFGLIEDTQDEFLPKVVSVRQRGDNPALRKTESSGACCGNHWVGRTVPSRVAPVDIVTSRRPRRTAQKNNDSASSKADASSWPG